jgi:spore coat polysaccharide biosynthesis protein SpsF
MRIVCFIEARMRSTRLPGKVLMPILGTPMLELMIERLRRARTLDGIVVATTDGEADQPIADLAERLGVGCFRGSEGDVLARVLGAARAYGADVIVETTGDCPLHEPALIDKVVSDFRLGGADFVSNILPYSTPRGTDCRVFTTDALDEIDRTSDDPADHEHVSLHFWEHPEKYRLRNVTTELPPEVTELRLTVDTPEDINQEIRQKPVR